MTQQNNFFKQRLSLIEDDLKILTHGRQPPENNAEIKMTSNGRIPQKFKSLSSQQPLILSS